MYKTGRKITICIAFIGWILYCILLGSGQYFAADAIAPIVSLAVSICIAIVAFSIRKYRLCLIFIMLGPIFWMIADFTYLLCDLGFIAEHSIEAISEPIYRMTSYSYVVGLIIFAWIKFRKRYILRLAANAFLFAIATFILSISFFQMLTKMDITFANVHPTFVQDVFVAMFIVTFFLVILGNNDNEKVSFYGITLLISFMLYGVLDVRYSLYDAAGGNGGSLTVDVLYLLSIVLLGFAHSTDTVYHLFERPDRKDSNPNNRIGIIMALVILILGIMLCGMGHLPLSQFFILLITSMAYMLLTKTIQANELTQRLIVQKDEELNKVSEKLAKVSVLDMLTGLKNRRAWKRRIEDLKLQHSDSHLILYSLDIDYFKMINDTYGHEAADSILTEIGRRLSYIEDTNVTSYRMDGDQFAVLCIDEKGEVDPARFVDYLIDELDRPYEYDENIIHITFTIGAAIYPTNTKDIDKLMSCAESVRKSSRPNGNLSTCEFFDASIMPRLQRKNLIENRLQNLDYDANLELYYQPQVLAATGELIGMEALLRWNDQDLGFVSPAEFIPISENMGIMPALGQWIVEQAVYQITSWNQTFNKNLRMGINVSPAQLSEDFFTDSFFEIMDEMGVKPGWVDAEITEGIALNGTVNNADFISRLQEAGISLSVDDFGTGYASFANMINFKFNRIKIAKELVDDLTTKKTSKVIVGAIINMAKGMNLATIAEGVEDKAQLDILIDLGCDEIQGYYFGKPIPANEFEEKWLR